MSKTLDYLTSVVLVLALAATNPVFAREHVVEVRVSASEDDAEEHVLNGDMESLTSSDLELGHEGNQHDHRLQTIACRWASVGVPNGAVITKAWVQFSADDINNDRHVPDVSVVIEGQLSADPNAFVREDFGISTRPTTAATVVWDIPRWFVVHERGPDEQTPNIASVIQELVDQPDWVSGNAMVLFFRDNPDNPSEGTRESESFDGRAAEAPLLHIELEADFAIAPSPADGTTDIPWYILPELSWTPGASAQSSNVYFSTNVDDVADANATALVSEGQAGTTYQVMATELETTYYWRVDSIDGDGTVTAGDVWSFTMEAVTFPDPIADVTATADSEFSDSTSAANTVNGSGLTDGLHGTTGTDMWLSAGLPATIQFDFDRVYSVHEMQIWNQNQAIESLLGFGAKDVTIEVSANGTDFTALDGVGPLNQASGSDSAANSIIALNGALLKSVRMTINTVFGGLPQTGLSEVQFTVIPAFPRDLSPADGSDLDGLNVDLSWRGGRFAVEHQVLASKDRSAVEDGSAVVATTADKSYALWGLDYGSVYFVQIIDVGADGTTYAGPINHYYTPRTAAVDDMESEKISKTWKDGTKEFANSSTVSSSEEAYEGERSLALDYDTVLGSYAFVTRTFNPPLDLTGGAANMLGVWFLGDPNNDPGSVSMVFLDSDNKGVKVTHPDAAATTLTAWTLFEIPLSEIDRLNLKEIRSIALRVRAPGAVGTVLWDFLHLGAAAANVYLEAEAADVLGASWRVVEDPNASGGWRIGSENDDGNDNNFAPGPEWIAVYDFDAPVAGGYNVILRAQEAGSDSFWVRIVGADAQTLEDPDQPGTGWVRFNGIDAPDGWTWDKVHSNDHDNRIVKFALPAGPLTLEIGKREDGTYVDAILITTDVNVDQSTLPDALP